MFQIAKNRLIRKLQLFSRSQILTKICTFVELKSRYKEKTIFFNNKYIIRRIVVISKKCLLVICS